MSEEYYVEGEPSCNNCGSTELEARTAENGQFMGSECMDCGVLNVASMYREDWK